MLRRHVGPEGRGESTWLGFFLHTVLRQFVPICQARADRQSAERFQQDARRLASRLELAWDGEWFRRGYYDDGTPLGSGQNDECRIDSIAQTWAVLSGAVPLELVHRVGRLDVLCRSRKPLGVAPARSGVPRRSLHSGCVATATMDGRPVDPTAIPLIEDGGTHTVEIALGEPSGCAQPEANLALSAPPDGRLS